MFGNKEWQDKLTINSPKHAVNVISQADSPKEQNYLQEDSELEN